jgi:large conductance mechanosensitive channel
MGLLHEFRQFAIKGNVVDMAVGIVIGGAFGKIVTSLVNDVIMPAVGKITGGVDFKAMTITLQQAVIDAQGKEVTPAVEIRYGMFINTVIDFLLVAWAIFIVIKAMNAARERLDLEPTTEAPKAPPEDILLLREIRDSLAAR